MLGHGPNEEIILLLFQIEVKWTEISKELQTKLVWPYVIYNVVLLNTLNYFFPGNNYFRYLKFSFRETL